ncbi:MAG: hypothetical protein H6767_02720 [Candidatus Peribacteria bacterium]|nr:MAG: hypothetical protein H6767_02720 [Candidatus Peribacteria bacterium]
MKNNPYIEKVLAHPYIFTKEEDIYGKQGKWCEYFENDHALVLEIGTGHGNFFSSEVHDHPEKNYIGMEIKYKRLYSTAEKCLGNKSNYAQSSGTDTTNFVLLKEYGQKIGTIF